MPSESKQSVRLAIAHLSAATTLFVAGLGAVKTGSIVSGLILMVIAVGYLIYELVTSEPVTKNIPGMFRLLAGIFAVTIFLGVNRSEIQGWFPSSTPITHDSPTPSPTPSASPVLTSWDNKNNWRKSMRLGMTHQQVRKLFGEPENISVIEDREEWWYGMGLIVFENGVVDGWQEPPGGNGEPSPSVAPGPLRLKTRARPLREETFALANKLEEFAHDRQVLYDGMRLTNADTEQRKKLHDETVDLYNKKFDKAVHGVLMKYDAKGAGIHWALVAEGGAQSGQPPSQLVTELRKLADKIDSAGHLVK